MPTTLPAASEPPSLRLGRVVLFLLALVPYVALAATTFLVFNESADDPFITFRYAYNLVQGHGPVFNVGERVEGFTSPLHLILCVVLLKSFTSVGMLFKAKLASVLFGAGTVLTTGRLARQVGLTGPQAILTQTLLALECNFAIAAVNGLETTMYACLVVVTVGTYLQELDSGQGLASAGWLFLAWLARPEALLVFCALAAVRLVRTRQRTLSPSNTATWLAVFAIPALALVLVRLAYYGLPFPNTYYAKSMPLVLGLQLGGNGLMQGFSTRFLDFDKAISHDRIAILYIAFTMAFWVLALLGWSALRRTKAAIVFPSVIGATFIFMLRSGGDWMLGWRFMVGVLPLVTIFQVLGVGSLAASRKEERTWVNRMFRWPAAYGATTLLWIAALAFSPRFPWSRSGFGTSDRDLLRQGDPLSALWLSVGDFMRGDCPPGALIAYSEMGYGTWINLDKQFIDTRGLNSREIGHMPAEYKSRVGVEDLGWYRDNSPLGRILLKRHPDYIFSFDGHLESREGQAQVSQALGEYHLAQFLLSTKPHVGIFVPAHPRQLGPARQTDAHP